MGGGDFGSSVELRRDNESDLTIKPRSGLCGRRMRCPISITFKASWTVSMVCAAVANSRCVLKCFSSSSVKQWLRSLCARICGVGIIVIPGNRRRLSTPCMQVARIDRVTTITGIAETPNCFFESTVPLPTGLSVLSGRLDRANGDGASECGALTDCFCAG